MKTLVSPSPLLRASRLLVAAGLAWTVLAGLAAGDLAARRTAALADEPWIVIGSNRDGALRAYSLRSDGSRLTRLLPGGSRLVPIVISRNGETVLYTTTWFGEGAMYVSRASGTGLRRLAKGDASGPALSGDGRWLAFSPGRGGISIVRTDGRGRRQLMKRCDCGVSDWSPNGRSVVLNGGKETLDGDGVLERISVLPLHGKRRIVARMGENTGQHHDHDGAAWSPDGRWIAYLNLEDNNRRIGLYLVRPNGKQAHRIVRGAVITMAWSPDGKKLAFVYEKGQVAVVGVDGRGLTRLPLGATAHSVAWSPDGQRLAVAAAAGEDRSQIFVVGEDGRDARRVTAEGENSLIGWTTRAPVLPPAPPIPPSERVLDARSVATATPVAALSADGTRVAFVPNARAADCTHAAVWTLGENSIARFVLPAPCRPEVPRSARGGTGRLPCCVDDAWLRERQRVFDRRRDSHAREPAATVATRGRSQPSRMRPRLLPPARRRRSVRVQRRFTARSHRKRPRDVPTGQPVPTRSARPSAGARPVRSTRSPAR